jgi:hypothetical protein
MPKKLPMKRKKLEGTCFESGQRIGRGEILEGGSSDFLINQVQLDSTTAQLVE